MTNVWTGQTSEGWTERRSSNICLCTLKLCFWCRQRGEQMERECLFRISLSVRSGRVRLSRQTHQSRQTAWQISTGVALLQSIMKVSDGAVMAVAVCAKKKEGRGRAPALGRISEAELEKFCCFKPETNTARSERQRHEAVHFLSVTCEQAGTIESALTVSFFCCMNNQRWPSCNHIHNLPSESR